MPRKKLSETCDAKTKEWDVREKSRGEVWEFTASELRYVKNCGNLNRRWQNVLLRYSDPRLYLVAKCETENYAKTGTYRHWRDGEDLEQCLGCPEKQRLPQVSSCN